MSVLYSIKYDTNNVIHVFCSISFLRLASHCGMNNIEYKVLLLCSVSTHHWFYISQKKWTKNNIFVKMCYLIFVIGRQMSCLLWHKVMCWNLSERKHFCKNVLFKLCYYKKNMVFIMTQNNIQISSDIKHFFKSVLFGFCGVWTDTVFIMTQKNASSFDR